MAYRTVEGRRTAFCDQCLKPIPTYQNGAVPEGYVSPEIWRIDQDSVEGVAGIRPVSRTVCNPCYREAWARQYPDQPCQLKAEDGEPHPWQSPSSPQTYRPVPEEPSSGTDGTSPTP